MKSVEYYRPKFPLIFQCNQARLYQDILGRFWPEDPLKSWGRTEVELLSETGSFAKMDSIQSMKASCTQCRNSEPNIPTAVINFAHKNITTSAAEGHVTA